NEKGLTEAVVTRQIKGAFSGVNNPPLTIVIAYEPIWAIGTGKAATGEQANRTVGTIRSVIAGLYGKSYADLIRIQYGGSTNAKNIAEFIQQPEIDGALVGGASLKASDFISMVEQTARIKDS
ncbi:MAG: triose-phosphate isomerase, partial [Chloroflexi bacterium]|nr:triose-phosphate isomerase [Chloroflexota bacterium]